MEYLAYFKDISSIIQLVVIAGVIIVLYKNGVLGFLLNKNGNGNDGKKALEEIKEIKENHLSHLEVKMDKLIEISQEVLILIRDIKNDTKRNP